MFSDGTTLPSFTGVAFLDFSLRNRNFLGELILFVIDEARN
jgi:hypothetical protein